MAMNKLAISRDNCRKIKRMDREEMGTYLAGIWNQGYKAGIEAFAGGTGKVKPSNADQGEDKAQ
ncbi:MAG: hypothetical protein RSC06_15700 [Clostridia bacterium]